MQHSLNPCCGSGSICKMAQRFHFVLGFSFGLFLFSILYLGAVEGNDFDLLPDCKTLVDKLIEEHMKIYEECVKEFKGQEWLGCAVKCALGKASLLNDEQKVTNITLQKFMDTWIPELYQGIGHRLSDHCLEEFGVDVSDESCSSYAKYGECMQHVVTKVCA